RGFPEVIVTGLRDYLIYADSLADLAPVHHVRLISADSDIDEADRPWPDADTEFWYEFHDPYARLLRELAASPHLTRWRSLDTNGRYLDPALFSLLFESPYLTGLARLDIERSCPGESLRLLTRNEQFSTLRHLNLYGGWRDSE